MVMLFEHYEKLVSASDVYRYLCYRIR